MERFALCSTEELISLTHREGQPWHRVWEVENQHFVKIPYEYVLEENEKDYIQSLEVEREEILNNYK